MLTAILSSVVLGWVRRRLQEVIGWGIAIVPIYMALPMEYQGAIKAILTGQGGGLSISTAIGLLIYGYTQWQSFRSTTKNQIVAGGQQVAVKDLPVLTREQVKDMVQEQTGVRPVIIEKPSR